MPPTDDFPELRRSIRRIDLLGSRDDDTPARTERRPSSSPGLLSPFSGCLRRLVVRAGEGPRLDHLVIRPFVSPTFVTRVERVLHVAAAQSTSESVSETSLATDARPPAPEAVHGHTHERLLTVRQFTRLRSTERHPARRSLATRGVVRRLVSGSNPGAPQRFPTTLRLVSTPGRRTRLRGATRSRTPPGSANGAARGSSTARDAAGEEQPPSSEPRPLLRTLSALVHDVEQATTLVRASHRLGRHSLVHDHVARRVLARTRTVQPRREPDDIDVAPRVFATESVPEHPSSARSGTASRSMAPDESGPRLTVRRPDSTPPADGAEPSVSPTTRRHSDHQSTNVPPTPSPAPLPTDEELDRLTDRVYDRFERKLRIERERRGIR